MTNSSFSNLSKQQKAEYAIQMVIIDAIEKGHTDACEICEYMKSEVFSVAVERYISMM